MSIAQTPTDRMQPVVLGFPSDLPSEAIEQINDLATREALGQHVPAFVCKYVSADGTERAVMWLPLTNFATFCDRLGIPIDDRPEAA